MKPMKQHEYSGGVDWAINAHWGWRHGSPARSWNMAIEDMAITDNLGFYIGNPGSHLADVLHRPTVTPDASGNNYYNTVRSGAECPPVIGPFVTTTGRSFRLTRRLRPTGSGWSAILTAS